MVSRCALRVAHHRCVRRSRRRSRLLTKCRQFGFHFPHLDPKGFYVPKNSGLLVKYVRKERRYVLVLFGGLRFSESNVFKKPCRRFYLLMDWFYVLPFHLLDLSFD